MTFELKLWLIPILPPSTTLPPPAIPTTSTPEKITGIFAEPSHTTSTISPINTKAQPGDDTGNEALGRASFGEGDISTFRSSAILMNMRSVVRSI
ncbi:MAG: hypothetical protein NTV84_10210 [Methanoregula sp.]|nr:hypothetical protein [Methanoregula sp.]